MFLTVSPWSRTEDSRRIDKELKAAIVALDLLRQDDKAVAPYLAILYAMYRPMPLLPSVIIATRLAGSADGTFWTGTTNPMLDHS